MKRNFKICIQTVIKVLSAQHSALMTDEYPNRFVYLNAVLILAILHANNPNRG